MMALRTFLLTAGFYAVNDYCSIKLRRALGAERECTVALSS